MRASHRLTCPPRQKPHAPQETVESSATRSPDEKPWTPGPTRSMTPAASCPITSGGIRRPVDPSYPWMSLPHTPHARTRTSTSSSPISGVGISTTDSFRYSDIRSALIGAGWTSAKQRFYLRVDGEHGQRAEQQRRPHEGCGTKRADANGTGQHPAIQRDQHER